MSDSQTLTLPSGRVIGYASYGSPTGHTLLYFHGFPSSRLEAYALSSLASQHKIHILSLDRPGFGLSTPDSSRTITSWPTDVQEFTSALEIEKFAILGVSGGGPYALACAEQLPKEKLSAVGVLAGAAIWDRGVRTKGVPWYVRLVYLGAHYWPGALRVVSATLVGVARWVMTRKWVEGKIDGLLEKASKEKAGKEKKEDSEDGVLISKTEGEEGSELPPVRSTAQRREGLMGLFFEGFAQGAAELVREAKLLSQDWGFRFEDIGFDRVLIWHGSKDINAPVERIRSMAEQIPHCVLKEFDENHFGMGHHLEEVFDELVAEIERNDKKEKL